MSEAPYTEREQIEQLWRALNVRADTLLKASQWRFEPWKILIAAVAAAGGLLAAGAAAATLILHVLGKI